MTEIDRRNLFLAGTAVGLAAAGTVFGSDGAFAQAAAQGANIVTLLLVNDIYKMSDVKGRGGFARLAAIAKAERASGRPVLYVHGGDQFSPSLMSGFDKGAHTIELLNVAPPDLFVPGNHEFDFGTENYAALVAASKSQFIAANLRGPGNAVLPRHIDRKIFELGGVKIGVFGVALADTPLMSQTGDLVFLDEMQTVKDQVKALKAEGAELIVALTHTDFTRDLEIFRSRLVDVLLTGHDHDLRVVYDNKSVMVESGEEGEYVTAVDLALTVTERDGKRQVSFVPRFRIIDSGTVTPDPEALAIVKKYEAELSRELDIEIGTLGAPLDSRGATVRSQEAAMGNLIADAIRTALGADIAITNGGGIRGNKQYPAGHKLTRRDVLTELPFGNSSVMVEIKGSDVKSALENGVSQIDSRAGRFPQVSGLSFVFDAKAPVGSRIVSVKVGDQPLDPNQRYKVASNNFMLEGGDGYNSLRNGKTLVGKTDGKLLANEVMTYARKLGTVTLKVEGRITERQ